MHTSGDSVVVGDDNDDDCDGATDDKPDARGDDEASADVDRGTFEAVRDGFGATPDCAGDTGIDGMAVALAVGFVPGGSLEFDTGVEVGVGEMTIGDGDGDVLSQV